ncbi:glucose dehydrogenase [Blastopirellula marina]|uniref:Glucose dehydrogenase n=1 Tax=Blastopirellula marina TaxID=124 RepID=A0A2S8FPB1_9BACT|nr:glucose dehydrogenase [Blastopirellula marina]PTL43811.1 glucose dehydrogenase [Blastopirellula marina]
MLTHFCLVTGIIAGTCSWLPAQVPEPEVPQLAPASDEGEKAISGFKVPDGFKMSLFAAEPMMANPVAFCLDDLGRVYVAETYRQGQGVEDNRGHNYWLIDDLAAQSVADRRAYILKHHPEAAQKYTQHDDRIRLLIDSDGDGQADKDTIFSAGYNDIVEGTGAGVLALNGDIFYTNIPTVWKLRDEDGDGVADEKVALSEGYGVRFAFRGHDLHGLTLGPDGKIYFSIGDRGYNIEADGATLKDPGSGAVFRCNLDGSNLEVFCTGLRNPQELAFDDYGNLFTCDNNSDSGDQARWIYLLQGGHTGWNMAYQYLSDRGPWNREKLWHPHHEGQAAYIVPPIINISDGPSGLVYYPGTGFGKEFAGTFFLCDFRGGPANSGIRTFRMKPNGATFDLVDSQEFVWKILCTDVDFGPDGGMYISDWVDGWTGLNKGRLYRLTKENPDDAQLIAEVKELLPSDFSQKTDDQLAKLLQHADRRVRLKAQFALAAAKKLKVLEGVAQEPSQPQLARIHAIWGIGQIAEQEAKISQRVEAAGLLSTVLVNDEDPEIRAQVGRVLGELRVIYGLPKLLEDDNARVLYFAMLALGNAGPHGDPNQVIDRVAAILAKNADQDPALRHGGIMALAGMRNIQSLADLANHPSPSVRIAAVVALRRLESPSVVRFLSDGNELVVLEAVRAIHDLPMENALGQAARLIDSGWKNDALLRRVLNANFRLGEPENAEALARFATRSDMPEAMRLEALEMLANWKEPGKLDRVLNFYRPLEDRDEAVAKEALAAALSKLLTTDEKVRNRAASLAASLGIKEVAPVLIGLAADAKQSPETRADAIIALTRVAPEKVMPIVKESLASDAPLLRAVARDQLAKLAPAEAAEALAVGVEADSTVERQHALAALANAKPEGAQMIVAAAMSKLLAGDLAEDSRLDAIEAAAAFKDSPEIASLLEQYRLSLDPADPLAEYRVALAGGNFERGRKIFFEKTEVSCVRCHRAMGTGGRVGPELDALSETKPREYLLEAVVQPNAKIAEGFESILVLTVDGQTYSGVIKEETDDAISLVDADGKLITISQEDIEGRKSAKSPMPDDIFKHLSKSELRDLVEFLANLKKGPQTGGHE